MARKKADPPFDQVAYNQQYIKENITRVSVTLNKKHDKDIIEHLGKQQSKSNYIKRLIRSDLQSEPDQE